MEVRFPWVHGPFVGPGTGAGGDVTGTHCSMDELTRLALNAREGDREALERFVRVSQPAVWRLCAHLGGRSEADDLTQETFLRAIAALPAFRGDASARTWLLVIARRTCVDAVRRAIRRRRLLERSPLPSLEAPDDTGALDLDELVSRLDEDRRVAFVLTQILGLSYAETAEVCSCPIGTIRSRVARARGELLGSLSDEQSATG